MTEIAINYGESMVNLWLIYDIENGPVETVSFPIHSMVIYDSYVNVYQSKY